ncbi:hypothetical protein KAR91_40515 [Candidatus Pacearchaeota archaeon]|nr:hypothetical protein [Candidatus Pacearchaeota archaeon]
MCDGICLNGLSYMTSCGRTNCDWQKTTQPWPGNESSWITPEELKRIEYSIHPELRILRYGEFSLPDEDDNETQ